MERDEDWELCNADGFVFKREKRSRISDHPGETSNPVDPAVEERNRRKRKKRTLAKLKSKYQREIHQWELMSNRFNAMQEKTIRFQTTTQQREDSRALNANEATSFHDSSASVFLDELLSMAEAQEVIINDVSNLWEVAEKIIRVGEEEGTKQLLFDLDVWSSPTNLMASLCAD